MDQARLIRQIHRRNSHGSEQGEEPRSSDTAFRRPSLADVLPAASAKSLTLAAIRSGIHSSDTSTDFVARGSRDARSSEFRDPRLRMFGNALFFRSKESGSGSRMWLKRGSIDRDPVTRKLSSSLVPLLLPLERARPLYRAVRLYLDHVMYHFFGLFRAETIGVHARVLITHSKNSSRSRNLKRITGVRLYRARRILASETSVRGFARHVRRSVIKSHPETRSSPARSMDRRHR